MRSTQTPRPFTVSLISLAASLALVACGAAGDEDLLAQRARAVAVANGFQAALKQELGAAMQSGGPAAAVAVCNERAPQLAAAAAVDDFTIRRIGTRARNPANQPSEEERDVLRDLEALDPTRDGPTPLIMVSEIADAGGADKTHYYIPIRIQDPVCLVCHGPREAMPAELVQTLDRLYPDDGATGYAMGELRGAFVVTHAKVE